MNGSRCWVFLVVLWPVGQAVAQVGSSSGLLERLRAQRETILQRGRELQGSGSFGTSSVDALKLRDINDEVERVNRDIRTLETLEAARPVNAVPAPTPAPAAGTPRPGSARHFQLEKPEEIAARETYNRMSDADRKNVSVITPLDLEQRRKALYSARENLRADDPWDGSKDRVIPVTSERELNRQLTTLNDLEKRWLEESDRGSEAGRPSMVQMALWNTRRGELVSSKELERMFPDDAEFRGRFTQDLEQLARGGAGQGAGTSAGQNSRSSASGMSAGNPWREQGSTTGRTGEESGEEEDGAGVRSGDGDSEDGSGVGATGTGEDCFAPR